MLIGAPWCLSSKEFACQAEDVGLTHGLERSPGEGNGNPLQYLCLENPVDGGAWRATVHRLARVRHDLATRRQQQICKILGFMVKCIYSKIYKF